MKKEKSGRKIKEGNKGERGLEKEQRGSVKWTGRKQGWRQKRETQKGDENG